MALSARARRILEQIAAGKSHEQILAADSTLTYKDIFAAAQEALASGGDARPRQSRDPEERWTAEQDVRLRRLVDEGKSVRTLAAALRRKLIFIQTRLVQLGLASTASLAAPAGHSPSAGEATMCKWCGILIPGSRLRATAGVALCEDCESEQERVSAQVAAQNCPECDGRLVERFAPEAEAPDYYLGCSNFPSCRYTGSS